MTEAVPIQAKMQMMLDSLWISVNVLSIYNEQL